MSDDHRKPFEAASRSRPEGDDVARLLRVVASPPPVPRAAFERAKAVARQQWDETLRKGRRRRVAMIAGLAAALLVVLAATVVRLQPLLEPISPPLVATLEVVRGEVTAAPAESPTVRHRLHLGDRLAAGAVVETGAEARAAFRLGGGQSLRLDATTRVRMSTAETIDLERGRLYVDSPPELVDARLEIRTPLGIARDLGTQFEVRFASGELRVRVREGVVMVEGEGGSHRTEKGAELTVASGGRIHRRPLSPYGPDWHWSQAIAPVYQLEGSTVAALLRWVSRETGWRVEYSDPTVALAAEGITLHGSLEGVPPDATPALVLETCGLRHRIVEGILIVDDRR